MQPGEFLDQREPDAGAFMGAAVLALDPLKALEQPGHLAFADSDSGVSHAQFYRPGTAARPERLRFAFEGVLESVGDQIEDDLLPHLAVDKGRRRPPARNRSQARGRPCPSRIEKCSRAPRCRRQYRSVPSAPATRPASRREKSSSVLTSFRSRSPLRRTSSICSPRHSAYRRRA